MTTTWGTPASGSLRSELITKIEIICLFRQFCNLLYRFYISQSTLKGNKHQSKSTILKSKRKFVNFWASVPVVRRVFPVCQGLGCWVSVKGTANGAKSPENRLADNVNYRPGHSRTRAVINPTLHRGRQLFQSVKPKTFVLNPFLRRGDR